MASNRIEQISCVWCNRPLWKTHWRQKYHQECAREAKKTQDKERMRQKRAQETLERLHHQLEKSNVRQKSNVRHSSTALEVYTEEAQKDELRRFLRDALAPFFFEQSNRLARVEAGLDELGRVFPLTPSRSKKYPWMEQAIRKTMILIQGFGHLPKWQLRQFLEDAFQTGEKTAIEIMKKAEERLRRMKRDWGQMDLGDFT